MEQFVNELSAIQNDALELQSEAARLRARVEAVKNRRLELYKSAYQQVRKLLKFMFDIGHVKIKL